VLRGHARSGRRGAVAILGGEQVRHANGAGEPVLRDTDDGERVEAVQRQRREVGRGEGPRRRPSLERKRRVQKRSRPAGALGWRGTAIRFASPTATRSIRSGPVHEDPDPTVQIVGDRRPSPGRSRGSGSAGAGRVVCGGARDGASRRGRAPAARRALWPVHREVYQSGHVVHQGSRGRGGQATSPLLPALPRAGPGLHYVRVSSPLPTPRGARGDARCAPAAPPTRCSLLSRPAEGTTGRKPAVRGDLSRERRVRVGGHPPPGDRHSDPRRRGRTSLAGVAICSRCRVALQGESGACVMTRARVLLVSTTM